MRALALVTDAFGGHGGIARYNQAFLRALASLQGVEEVVVLPRFGWACTNELPPRLHQLPPRSGKAAYIARALGFLASAPRFDLLFCGHIYMAAVGAAVAALLRCPWWLQIHGVDAWAPPPSRTVRAALARADLVTAVSRHTRRRFLAWAELEPRKVRVLPNTVDPCFSPGPKPIRLLECYNLIGKRVLLTVSRLSAQEGYKGHDRVLAALSALRPRYSDLAYAIVGDGDARPRLEALASELGIADLVRFVGQVPDKELVEHYRVADVFVMPSTKEGFGIVFLEAMACGVPAIGGDADGSVDPLSAVAIGRAVPVERVGDAIADVLENPQRGGPSSDLAARFGFEPFTAQIGALSASLAPTGARLSRNRTKIKQTLQFGEPE